MDLSLDPDSACGAAGVAVVSCIRDSDCRCTVVGDVHLVLMMISDVPTLSHPTSSQFSVISGCVRYILVMLDDALSPRWCPAQPLSLIVPEAC